MQRILWFKDIRKEDVPKVGGKAANLGEMFSIRLPVPEGFCVSAQTYKEFIEKTGIKETINNILKQINIEDTEQLQGKANEIQRLIISKNVPKEIQDDIIEAYETLAVSNQTKSDELVKEPKEFPFVAVRSSATAEDLPSASFAGQQKTFLNVKGKEKLVKAVRGCWASLFTARAIYYREKNNFPHEKVLIAVAIQRMVNSSKSGVIFSINPATNNMDEIVIEAVYGLGETIVSGAVNPNTYVVDKKTMDIKSVEVRKQIFGIFRDIDTGKNIKEKIPVDEQKKQILKEKQIIELAELAKRIEKHYKVPQDIEWAVEDDKIFIVQSRAVTTIGSKEKKEIVGEHKVLVKGETASPGAASGIVKVVHDINELDKISKGDILVTTMTTPDMVPAMKRAGGIVTDEGGMTCHAAIVSREMGIPCVVGTENGTKTLKEGEVVTVNATHGEVYEGRIEIKEEIKPEEIVDVKTKTKVNVIMDLPDFAEKAAQTGADGVGLVRLEIMIANAKVHPAEYIRTGNGDDYINILVEGIKKIAEAFKGKPVWVRTSDIRTDEYRNLEGGDKEPKEDNPMLGWHAIRRALDEPEILKAEFTAIKILHKGGLDNVGIMLPFIIRAREVRAAKKIAEDVGLDLDKVEFGVMIETPAACWIIEELAKENINFVSFGTNDLTQMTLGIDRNNEKISNLYDEMHPSVLREISHVIKFCKKHGIKTSICGQAGSRPEMAKFLVKQGIDSISANPDAVHKIRHVVSKVEKELGINP